MMRSKIVIRNHDLVEGTNQALETESEYLELKRNLNTIIIDLHYLTNNDERSE